FFPRTTAVANPSTWDTVFRFTGGNSAEPMLLPTRDGNVMGLPKAELSTMGTGTTTGTKLIIAGDFQAGYLIADRLGMSVELVPHLLAPPTGSPRDNVGSSRSGARAGA